jgi:hypothetical protein
MAYDDCGEGRGNGYDHDAGMSNNALDAYNRGVKPLSRIDAQDLKDAGWEHTKVLAMFLAAEGFWRSSEWHHSGGEWFNKIEFYDPALLVSKWSALTDSEQETWTARGKESRSKDSQVEGEQVEGSYTIWGGSRRRPRRVGEQAFTGCKVGDWIHLVGGGKKKASGAHLSWRLVEV